MAKIKPRFTKSRSVGEVLNATGKLSKLKPRRVAGKMGATEIKFAAMFLDPLIKSGEITSWLFEPVTFRLAAATSYTPDFKLHLSDGTVIYFEVKGSWSAPNQDKSRAKLKVCAEMHSDARFASYEIKRKMLEWFGPHGSVPLSVFAAEVTE